MPAHDLQVVFPAKGIVRLLYHGSTVIDIPVDAFPISLHEAINQEADRADRVLPPPHGDMASNTHEASLRSHVHDQYISQLVAVNMQHDMSIRETLNDIRQDSIDNKDIEHELAKVVHKLQVVIARSGASH